MFDSAENENREKQGFISREKMAIASLVLALGSIFVSNARIYQAFDNEHLDPKEVVQILNEAKGKAEDFDTLNVLNKNEILVQVPQTTYVLKDKR